MEMRLLDILCELWYGNEASILDILCELWYGNEASILDILCELWYGNEASIRLLVLDMSEDDTWSELQAFLHRHEAVKARLRRRKERRNGGGFPGEPSGCLLPVVGADRAIERQLLEALLNPLLQLPVEAQELGSRVQGASEHMARQLLRKFEAQQLLELVQDSFAVSSVDLDKVSSLVTGNTDLGGHRALTTADDLINAPSVRETESKKMSSEILDLLNSKSVIEQNMVEMFQSAGGSQLREFCVNKTRQDCRRVRASSKACGKLHFRKIIQVHTDESLGDCSFLNTCFHMDTCKFVHYEIDSSIDEPEALARPSRTPGARELQPRTKLMPAEWINCDLRFFDMSVIGKFAVVMADPPWDIHMELPYGTMSDDEMRQLNIPALQDNGYIFLWVTGRAMELGRECLTLWGYERVEDMIWVKTNQLQRLIRTGRTGHWLNHGKEHCLVGMKGSPEANRGIDCNVIVAEVRQTSHKPDEIYGVIERLSPGTRKIELFGRQHNCQPNWLTLGNQLQGIHIVDPNTKASFWSRYPNGEIDVMTPPSNFRPT